MASKKLDFNAGQHGNGRVKSGPNRQQNKPTKQKGSPKPEKQSISKEVYVGNFCYYYDKAKLLEIFSQYIVKNIRMYLQEQKAYAFVALSNQNEAERAVKEMNSKVFDGRKLLVKMARPAAGPTSSDTDSCQLKDKDNYDGLPPLLPISKKPDHSKMPSLVPIDEFSEMPPLEPIEEHSAMPPLEPIVDCQNAPEPLGQIVIGNFPYGSSEADLMSIFDDFQPLMCRIYINAPMSKLSRPTYAFIYVLNSRLAADAERTLHLSNYRGHVISVKNISQ